MAKHLKDSQRAQLNIPIMEKEIILISQSELEPKIITNMLIASLTVAISHNEAYWADRQLRVKLTRHHGPAHLVKNTAASTYRNLQLRACGCFIKNWCATHQYREHVVQKQHKAGSSSLESPESRAVSLSLLALPRSLLWRGGLSDQVEGERWALTPWWVHTECQPPNYRNFQAWLPLSFSFSPPLSLSFLTAES